jgi:hypothetical protein
MSDWIHGLPLGWMAILIFGGTFLSAAVILLVVHSLAVGDRARAFKAVSPALLPSLGIMFGLLVAFLAAQAPQCFLPRRRRRVLKLPTLSHFKRSTAIACARVIDITRGCL